MFKVKSLQGLYQNYCTWYDDTVHGNGPRRASEMCSF